MTANLIEMTDHTLDDHVDSSRLVLADFYAEWCPPCQRFSKLLPTLAEQFKEEVLFGKIDVDKNPGLSEAYEIEKIPTFILFKRGNIVERWEGIKTLLEMKKIIEKNIS